METPPPCHDFCCSDFALSPDDASLPLHDDVLDGHIHPIFAHSKWSRITPAGYDALLALPLRLATRILESDVFAKYLMTAAFGGIFEIKTTADGRPKKGIRTNLSKIDRKVSAGLRHPKRPFTRFPEAKKVVVDQHVRKKRDDFLLALVPMVDFVVEKLERRTTGGMTRASATPPPADFAQEFPHGCRSQIAINHACLENVKNLVQSRPEDAVIFSPMLLLTLTILHELGHAISLAVDGRKYPEPYFKNSLVAEAGFELECQVFGGRIAPMPRLFRFFKHKLDVKTEGLTIWKWPDLVIAAGYAKIHFELPQRTKRPPMNIMGRFPLTAAVALFTKSYWAETVPLLGSRPLFQALSLSRWQMAWRTPGGVVACSLRAKARSAKGPIRLHNIIRRQRGAGRIVAEDELDILEDSVTLRRLDE